MTRALLSRRDAAKLCGGLGASLLTPEWAASALAQASKPLLARKIPHGNGETLPVIGVGTSRVFEVGKAPEDRAGPMEVVKALIDNGGTLIDTAPSYGTAEIVVGDILAAGDLRKRAFIATKLERFRLGDEAAETRECLQRLKTDKIDVLQLHNISDPKQSLAGINALKAQGMVRYTGITTTFQGAYEAAEAILKREKPDFIEIDYAIDNRDTEARILPAAADAGAAVLVAIPFGRGRLFRATSGKTLPEWAAEFDCESWGQFFLKFVLGHPAVTAAIPATGKAQHMIDNLGAGHGRMPDAKMRAKMVQYIETLS